MTEGGEAAGIVDAGVGFESSADPLLLELGSRNVTGKRGKTIPREGPTRGDKGKGKRWEIG